MKRLVSGILCTALVATCLCGCGKSSDEEKESKETFYLLKEVVEKNDDGEVMYRGTYEYNNRGLVISESVDFPGTEEEPVYDEENNIYVYYSTPCDGVIDKERRFSYDKRGSVICYDLKDYNGEYEEYEYSYDEDGKVTGFSESYLRFGEMQEGIPQELKYQPNGSIELWSQNSEEPKMTRYWEMSGDRISKMEVVIGDRHTKIFEYDQQGNMTKFRFIYPGEPDTEATRTYDEKGRVTSEQGFRYQDNLITYEYRGDKLVTINGKKLEYQKKKGDEVIVTYMDYELTYEVVELTEEETELARYRWNQLCGGLVAPHGFRMGIYGVKYPVFDINTVLLLPRVING